MEALGRKVPLKRAWLVMLLPALLLSKSAEPIMSVATILTERTPVVRRELLQDGDLVFRAGRDMISGMVLSQSDHGQFSHVGIIVRDGNKLYVVHAVPADDAVAEGVRREPLEDFVSPQKARAVGYFRGIDLSASQQELLARYARRQIGKPFDGALLYSDDSALYCTELVAKAFAVAGVDLSSRVSRVRILTLREPAITPDALLSVGLLEPIEHSSSGMTVGTEQASNENKRRIVSMVGGAE